MSNLIIRSFARRTSKCVSCIKDQSIAKYHTVRRRTDLCSLVSSMSSLFVAVFHSIGTCSETKHVLRDEHVERDEQQLYRCNTHA